MEKCQLDVDGKFCLGCFRYIDEISGWQTFSEERKKVILNEIKLRKL
tara:strand:- start:615 stop:755 length:141 start_codon:yes stop_codon:yes gene_type:complete